jgi:hypothetical protein
MFSLQPAVNMLPWEKISQRLQDNPEDGGEKRWTVVWKA